MFRRRGRRGQGSAKARTQASKEGFVTSIEPTTILQHFKLRDKIGPQSTGFIPADNSRSSGAPASSTRIEENREQLRTEFTYIPYDPRGTLVTDKDGKRIMYRDGQSTNDINDGLHTMRIKLNTRLINVDADTLGKVGGHQKRGIPNNNTAGFHSQQQGSIIPWAPGRDNHLLDLFIDACGSWGKRLSNITKMRFPNQQDLPTPSATFGDEELLDIFSPEEIMTITGSTVPYTAELEAADAAVECRWKSSTLQEHQDISDYYFEYFWSGFLLEEIEEDEGGKDGRHREPEVAASWSASPESIASLGSSKHYKSTVRSALNSGATNLVGTELNRLLSLFEPTHTISNHHRRASSTSLYNHITPSSPFHLFLNLRSSFPVTLQFLLHALSPLLDSALLTTFSPNSGCTQSGLIKILVSDSAVSESGGGFESKSWPPELWLEMGSQAPRFVFSEVGSEEWAKVQGSSVGVTTIQT
ncbi:hypothetical protein MNV49_005180 [Pseudohyphozyma bogoriensis]|nr:hypothetical protein MNV49_005180 [Pseudohyphozyma bogoriensis]